MGSTGDFALRGSPEYFGQLRTDYNFRLTDAKTSTGVDWRVYYKIDIRLSPCGETETACCADCNTAACQDLDPSLGIDAGKDLQIAYLQNAHISTCAGTVYEYDPNCGTFLEIHRRGGDTYQVLSDLPLNKGDTLTGYFTAYMDTSGLCAGAYDIWWVVRTRSGPYVQFKKPFTVISPSC